MYSPTIGPSKMQSTHPLDSSKLPLERMYSTKEALNLNIFTQTMAEPKRENIFQTMFNSLTNFVKPIFVDQLSKVSLINNFSNLNNTLSVTIVPNEGIISHEFFKTLTGHKENLSDNMYIQSIQNKESSMDFVDTVTLNSKVYIPKDEYLESTNDSKFSTLDDFDLCLDTEPMFLYEKAFDNKDIIMKPTLEKDKSELIDIQDKNMKDKIVEDKIITKNKLIQDKAISSENLQNSKSLKDSPQEMSLSSSNSFSNMWQKVVNGVSDQFRSFSPALETCTKKHSTVKARRKANCVSSGRGRGRGKSQLRRNGVSQTRHRKERSKHDICSDIQDDVDTWEEFEAYTIENEDVDSPIDAEGPSCSLSFELIDIKPKKVKQRKNIVVKSENFSMKVRYVPECSLEERKANCTIDKAIFRSRLISETSVDSEDSYIVFETGSESDLDDINSFGEIETSESESDSEDETEDESPKQKVRFDLHPTIHKMVTWDFAYRAARSGPWEEMARDRERFRDRVTCMGRILEPVLAPDLRTKIWKERFATLV